MQLKLPYFDMIFARLACQDPEFEEVFWRHVHFGAWENLDSAYLDRPDSILAMERLCRHILTIAQVDSGQDILDVGCGFGGTLACLNEHFSSLSLTGLNIDPRQLEVAKQRVEARAGNSIDFVEGDACQMTFPSASFDRVLALECIFHFPSRQAFFSHVGRILRPGGNLTLSDFLLPDGSPTGLWDSTDDALWGCQSSIGVQDYRKLAQDAGLKLTHLQDISANVRPTYFWFGQLLGKHFPEVGKAVVESSFILDAGGVSYCTLRFDRV